MILKKGAQVKVISGKDKGKTGEILEINRKLNKIKKLRNNRLEQTDWMASSDVTMPDSIKTWRQQLRDLPQNNTTESQYNTLLARDSDKKLTNAIWTKPSE